MIGTLISIMCMSLMMVANNCHQPYKLWKWLKFEESYKISHLEIDLHISDSNLLGHECFKEQNVQG